MKWKVWLGLIALFLSGVLVGVAGTGFYLKGSLEQSLIGGHRPMMGKNIMRRLAGELQLTGEQRVEVGRIICEAERRLMETRRKHRPEVEEIIRGAIAQMKPLLTPEQQEKLDAMHTRARDRWKRQLDWHGGRHGGWDCT
ncbi:hypothetical protein [Syntrophobacter fumaroxidans]|uniref:Zinc resistance-associated protein n=1 Tax=Syntrophobacter fumaroxidans (strain DSM 10017 / MPOB) TaxID=335543 RepID=A0LMZ3_SYNFM|nr:hypothetical protein [Syntrophobacter fumaroxidans]ABK18795.1 hypothetical protein Sfum_3122 [Syntrophobacter fumaroxidans MPOB]